MASDGRVTLSRTALRSVATHESSNSGFDVIGEKNAIDAIGAGQAYGSCLLLAERAAMVDPFRPALMDARFALRPPAREALSPMRSTAPPELLHLTGQETDELPQV